MKKGANFIHSFLQLRCLWQVYCSGHLAYFCKQNCKRPYLCTGYIPMEEIHNKLLTKNINTLRSIF